MKIMGQLIHEIQVNKENVFDMLHTEIFRLLSKYGPHIRDDLFAIAIGPNAFKWAEEKMREEARFSMDRTDCMRFHGIRIVCGPLPFFVPLFNEHGWHYAHEEAKRITSLTGGVDA